MPTPPPPVGTAGGARPGAGRKKDLFKKMFDDAAKRIVTQEKMDKMVTTTVEAAIEGDMKATTLIFERLLGKVPLPVVGADGDDLKLELTGNVGEGLGRAMGYFHTLAAIHARESAADGGSGGDEEDTA